MDVLSAKHAPVIACGRKLPKDVDWVREILFAYFYYDLKIQPIPGTDIIIKLICIIILINTMKVCGWQLEKPVNSRITSLYKKEQAIATSVWRNINDVMVTPFYVSLIFVDAMLWDCFNYAAYIGVKSKSHSWLFSEACVENSKTYRLLQDREKAGCVNVSSSPLKQPTQIWSTAPRRFPRIFYSVCLCTFKFNNLKISFINKKNLRTVFCVDL